MKKIVLLFCLVAVLLVFLSGCTDTPTNQIGADTGNGNALENVTGLGANSGATATDNNVATDTSAEETGLKFNEWKAQDGSITLQVPDGWNATEKQVDTCTVNWSVNDSAGTSSAYMTNQVLVFKSEDAKQIYKAYGLTGIDNALVSDYLGAEAASSQIIAPSSGSTNLQIVESFAEMTSIFSQSVCISGLAACDAQVFDATYEFNGIQMKGKYFVQSFDLGDGSTWWINVWGFTAPLAQWENSEAVLEKIFTSVKYTESWATKCQNNTNTTSSVINEVIKKRQESAEKSAAEWDETIKGE